ncbi:MAG: tellurite resistance TerB family protein [Alphaproteobacteria bacterium]|nr:tellurite resistance TerB family protein [Alphaproteobacteria bacterium]
MMIKPHDALIYTMVMVSAADRNMSDAELQAIGRVVNHLPVFRDFDADTLPLVAQDCAKLLSRDDGLDRTLDTILVSLPEHLRETAYAIACDVAAADGRVVNEEVRLLQLLRDKLEVDRLIAAAIERGARARHQTA